MYMTSHEAVYTMEGVEYVFVNEYKRKVYHMLISTDTKFMYMIPIEYDTKLVRKIYDNLICNFHESMDHVLIFKNIYSTFEHALYRLINIKDMNVINSYSEDSLESTLTDTDDDDIRDNKRYLLPNKDVFFNFDYDTVTLVKYEADEDYAYKEKGMIIKL